MTFALFLFMFLTLYYMAFALFLFMFLINILISPSPLAYMRLLDRVSPSRVVANQFLEENVHSSCPHTMQKLTNILISPPPLE